MKNVNIWISVYSRRSMEERFIVNMCLTEIFHVFNLPNCVLRSVEFGIKPFKRSRFNELAGNDDFTATWLPKNRVTFTLYVDRNGCTLIGLKGRVYLAQADLMLMHSLPEDTCVLAHYTEDQVNIDAYIPKILIFDITRLDSNCLEDTKPFDRYKLLLSRCDMKMCNPIYTIQWVGFEHSVIEKFEELRMSLPHESEHIVRINRDPFRLSRLLTVQVPETSLQLEAV
eukprot:765736-Hanusia_phi.AAC.7